MEIDEERRAGRNKERVLHTKSCVCEEREREVWKGIQEWEEVSGCMKTRQPYLAAPGTARDVRARQRAPCLDLTTPPPCPSPPCLAPDLSQSAPNAGKTYIEDLSVISGTSAKI